MSGVKLWTRSATAASLGLLSPKSAMTATRTAARAACKPPPPRRTASRRARRRVGPVRSWRNGRMDVRSDVAEAEGKDTTPIEPSLGGRERERRMRCDDRCDLCDLKLSGSAGTPQDRRAISRRDATSPGSPRPSYGRNWKEKEMNWGIYPNGTQVIR